MNIKNVILGGLFLGIISLINNYANKFEQSRKDDETISKLKNKVDKSYNDYRTYQNIIYKSNKNTLTKGQKNSLNFYHEFYKKDSTLYVNTRDSIYSIRETNYLPTRIGKP